MIGTLKKRFILLAMSALTVLLTLTVLGMNLISYNALVKEADEILSVLSQNKGAFPNRGRHPGGGLPPHLSPEIPHESRFFSVSLDQDGHIVKTDVSKISAVDRTEAEGFARLVLEKREEKGFVEDYRYLVKQDAEGKQITFLDWGRRLSGFNTFLSASILMAAVGLAVVFIVVFILSGRILRPVAESYEKQKRFITDAGHEIKTPLSIIHANTDLLEMEMGENECLSDIRGQARRLSDLTRDLVMLARMEEEREQVKIEFPLSEVVEEAVRPFHALARCGEREIVCNIEPLLTLKGNARQVEQLVSILLDNALKYSPSGSRITLSLSSKGRSLCLEVTNPAATEVSPLLLDRVFDRFYRLDPSRNSSVAGHGIGLSVARAILLAHGGKISAHTHDGTDFTVRAQFPHLLDFPIFRA